MERILIELGLDPTIRRNEELMNELDYKYGQVITKYLYKEHPYIITSPKSTFDFATLEWTKNAVWATNNKTMKFFPVMIELTDEIMEQYILLSYYELYSSQDRVAFVFLSEQEYLTFMFYVKNNINRILSNKFPNLGQVNINKQTKEYKNVYLNKGKYFIGFDNIPFKEARIVIYGHGREGVDGIKIADIPIVSRKLVQRLMLLKMPVDSVIHLNSCYSACPANALNYTLKEIKYMFTNNMLDKIIETGEDSFLSVFHHELLQQSPSFHGEVHGYIGRVMQTGQKNILNKDGVILKRSNAVKVNGSDGFTLLKKEDARVSLSNKNTPF